MSTYPSYTRISRHAARLGADDDQVEIGVLVVTGFVAGVDFDRVGVGGRDVGLPVAGVRNRGAGVVATGDVGAVADVDGEDDVDRATALGCRDRRVAGPGEGGVAGAGG